LRGTHTKPKSLIARGREGEDIGQKNCELRSLLVFLCDLNIISAKQLYVLDMEWHWAEYYERILRDA
jgi:hypothetical protein